MVVTIRREPEDFFVDEQIFPVVVDYNKNPLQMVKEMPLKWITSIPYNKLMMAGKGIQEFNCSYVVVGEYGATFEQVTGFCKEQGINLARAEVLFAFGKIYPQEYGKEIGENRIIAGGTTWLCSHECVDEMLSLSWDSFYHCPGRKLSVEPNLGLMDKPPFLKGDRFLVVK